MSEKRVLENPEDKKNVKKQKVAFKATSIKRTWTHTAEDGNSTTTRLRKRTDSETDGSDATSPKAMSLKRTWTHTAKDGNSTSTRLRKRADSEMEPMKDATSSKATKNGEAIAEKLGLSLKRTWTHTAKDGNSTSTRLRKREEDELSMDEDDAKDEEKETEVVRPKPVAKPVAMEVDDSKEDEVEEDSDSINVTDYSADEDENEPEMPPGDLEPKDFASWVSSDKTRLKKWADFDVPIAKRKGRRNKLRRVPSYCRMWNDVTIASSDEEDEDAPPVLLRQESWNPNFKKKRKLHKRRQQVMGKLKSTLQIVTREQLEAEKPSHVIWFDLDPQGDECWWAVEVVDHTFNENGAVSELSIKFSGYSTEVWNVPAIRGTSHIYWCSNKLLKDKFAALAYDDNLEAVRSILQSSPARHRKKKKKKARRARAPRRARPTMAGGFGGAFGGFGGHGMFGARDASPTPPPAPTKEVTMKGHVTDAQDGGVKLGGVDLHILCMSTQTTRDCKTNEAGLYECKVDTGLVKITATKEGFAEAQHAIQVREDVEPTCESEVCMSKIIENDDTIRAVLRWSKHPRDLDSHIFCKGETEHDHKIKVFYQNKTFTHGDCTISLDRDVTNGYGPETVTITKIDQLPEDVHHLDYIVHHYSGFKNLVKSQASVYLYNKTGCEIYQVPTGPMVSEKGWNNACKFWHALRIDRNTKEVSLVNRFSAHYPSVDDVSKVTIPYSKRPFAPKCDFDNASDDQIQIVFSFDTTGSMYSCLDTVRRHLKKIIKKLLNEIPNLHIGLVAHGDYQDLSSAYVTQQFDFSRDVDALAKFVEGVGVTSGFDSDECYELVLHNVQRDFSWSPTCQYRSLVLIGDANPHPVDATNNPFKINWETEADGCNDLGIKIYGVHCLGNSISENFYKTCASKTSGLCIKLDNLDEFSGMMTAICHRELNFALNRMKSVDASTGGSSGAAAIEEAKRKFNEEAEILESSTVAQLKDLLRKNDQKLGGSKAVIIDRVVDCKIYGCLPRCPECGGGKLKVIYASEWCHDGEGEYYCPGYYDDTHFKYCHYRGSKADITRPDWQD